GAGGVELRDLVRQALRMRPDRLVVGEFRGAEIADLLVALNTGHRGGAATMHANSAHHVVARACALGTLAGLTPSVTASLVASGVDVVVHLERARGMRRVTDIGVLDGTNSQLCFASAWSADRGRGSAAEVL